jgi:hypothetical protein
MKVSFEVIVGSNKFTVEDTIESTADLFKKVSFFSQLPKEGPNGEKDLTLKYRTTKEGYEYYSIYSPSANKELSLGQSLKDEGALFIKFSEGWIDVPTGDSSSKKKTKSKVSSKQVDLDEDDDDLEETPIYTKSKAKVSKRVVEEDEEEDEAPVQAKTKSKVSKRVVEEDEDEDLDSEGFSALDAFLG